MCCSSAMQYPTGVISSGTPGSEEAALSRSRYGKLGVDVRPPFASIAIGPRRRPAAYWSLPKDSLKSEMARMYPLLKRPEMKRYSDLKGAVADGEWAAAEVLPSMPDIGGRANRYLFVVSAVVFLGFLFCVFFC